MVDVLDSKRSATKFRVLVEIADRQPAVNQGEIAAAVGVTSQAVSEYIRELVDEGCVEKEARSRYRVTQEGVDWLFQQASDMSRFIEYVTEDVLGNVQEDAAMATARIEKGNPITLSVQEGLLCASPGSAGPATGIATTNADKGNVVGVTGFEGVIDLEPGTITMFRIPSIRARQPTDSDKIASAAATAGIVAAADVESVGTLRASGIEPDTIFASGDVAADAANRGVDVVIVATTDNAGRVTDSLRDANLAYEVVDP